MATALKSRASRVRTVPPVRRDLAGLALAVVAVGLAVWGAMLARAGANDPQVVRGALVAAWGVAGAVDVIRRPAQRLGRLVVWASCVAALASLSSTALGVNDDGTMIAPGLVDLTIAPAFVDLARFALPVAAALIPPAGMHLLIGLPDGDSGGHRATLIAGYALGLALGLALWTQRPALPLWPVVVEAVLAGAVGIAQFANRYRNSEGGQRQRLQWYGWAVAIGAEVTVVAFALRLLSGWPPHLEIAVAAATLPIPLALALGSWPRATAQSDALLAHTVSIAGLTAVVVGVYVVIVVGLGRPPTDRERPLLGLSMVAAAVAAVLYVPARERLTQFSNRLVYGEREAPDEVLRTFGSRLSRSIPLDELLLQVAESLRKSLGLLAAEVWTGSGGQLERAVSVPETSGVCLVLGSEEESVVARAGTCGQAWVKVWMPALLQGREDAVLRMAPIVHSGRLLGLIVAVRPPTGEAFQPADDNVLSELARQVGLALHNVQLDSALQASLDQVRHQAEELQASRGRIVAAADAARRQIERNLHDGAQQHLVALAVHIRLARQMADTDPGAAKEMLDRLGHDLQDAVQELRNLAHGIYPPLLVDRGLVEALSAAAGRSGLPTTVQAEGIGRYSSEAEAAVYFCCIEALQNAAKHAGEGARATVRIWEKEGGLLFEVADDGAGFDIDQRRPRGAGFVNMADRVGAIGGTLAVESAPGRGTRVSARIPVTHPTGP